MESDIVARLRGAASEQYGCQCIKCEAADEIERLRKELGQVSDADAFVSVADAAHLDDLLDWCEFNDMNWHRALARLVADRARLRGELFPIRKELEEARAELESKTDELNRLREMRDRWIAGAQLHAARANQSPPEIRSHWDSADA